MNGEELNYIGPTSISHEEKQEPTEGQIKDEQGLGTLEKVLSLLRNRQEYYQSIDAISVGQDLTVENQMIVNKKVLFHLQELSTLLDKGINDTKERLNG